MTDESSTMEPLFDAIVKHIPPPRAKAGLGFQVLVANLIVPRSTASANSAPSPSL